MKPTDKAAFAPTETGAVLRSVFREGTVTQVAYEFTTPSGQKREALLTHFKGSRSWSVRGAVNRPAAGMFTEYLCNKEPRRDAVKLACQFVRNLYPT